jgi:methyl-accepting chemotaxis protein
MALKWNRKSLINAGIGIGAIVLLIITSLVHFDIQSDTKKEIREKLIGQSFAKKKSELERFFNLGYQTLRTISLLPSVRNIVGENRKHEDEDVVKSGRFSREAKLTVQQLYNNLASNVSVSEIYIVLSGFTPASGQLPFVMYDEIILSEKRVAGTDEAKSIDQPEEVENEEYQYFVKKLEDLRHRPPEYSESDSLDWIPAYSSHSMRTCDNSQYRSVVEGNLKNAEGFIYAVPIFSFTKQIRGLVGAIFRTNQIEALLLDVPKLIITEADETDSLAKNWKMPEEPSHFYLIQKNNKLSIGDRRQPNGDQMGSVLISKIENQIQDDDYHFEKLDIHDTNDWYLAYDLSYQPWQEQLAKNNLILFFEICLILIVAFSILYVRKIKDNTVNKIKSDVLQKISESTQVLTFESQEAKQNGIKMDETSGVLKSATSEMASALSQVEGTACRNDEIARDFAAHFATMAGSVDQLEVAISRISTNMMDLLNSTEQINEVNNIIRQIGYKTKSINEVVVKTQMLALNAAIEAERAGEQGKGFAVVAKEVGGLATRIGSLAEEISVIVVSGASDAQAIVATNKEKVSRNNQNVTEMSGVMTILKQQTFQLVAQTESVANCINEQKMGLKSISSCINQVQSVTDENLALAKTSLALSEKLLTQTRVQDKVLSQINQLLN